MTNWLFIYVIFLVDPTIEQQTSSYTLILEKIDNQTEVILNDSVIYSSKIIEGNPDLNIEIDITPFMIKGKNKLKIKLYNGSKYNREGADKHWEIRYELLKNDEPIDYIWESADDYKSGLSYEKTYTLD